MALTTIANACTFDPDRSRGTVVLESSCEGPPFQQAHDELSAPETRRYAQGVAAKVGVANARINGNVSIFPVNKKGVPLDKVVGDDGQPLAQTHADMQPYRYRIEVPVASPFM